jgi:hypothetical protein
VRENAAILGSLTADFNFSQAPRPPLLLPVNPPTDSPVIPAYFTGKPACVGCILPGLSAPGPHVPAAAREARQDKEAAADDAHQDAEAQQDKRAG